MAITRDNTKIQTWFERDRAHVALLDASSEDVLIEWWDEAVQEAVDDGFLDPKDWHGSAVDYANHIGIGCDCPALETGGRHSRDCPAGNPKRIGFGLVPEVEDAYTTGEEAAKRLIAAGRGKQENPHQLLLVENSFGGHVGGPSTRQKKEKAHVFITPPRGDGSPDSENWVVMYQDRTAFLREVALSEDLAHEKAQLIACHILKRRPSVSEVEVLSSWRNGKPIIGSDIVASWTREECKGWQSVLCQCGWGRLAMPESQIPEYCPVCGDVLRRENRGVSKLESLFIYGPAVMGENYEVHNTFGAHGWAATRAEAIQKAEAMAQERLDEHRKVVAVTVFDGTLRIASGDRLPVLFTIDRAGRHDGVDGDDLYPEIALESLEASAAAGQPYAKRAIQELKAKHPGLRRRKTNGAVALWETPPPTEWVELHEDEDGYSFRTSGGESDNLGGLSRAEAIDYVERKVIGRRKGFKRHNPDDYAWECSQCGPGPVRRCDGCRKVARLAPLSARRGGTFLPSEAALNHKKASREILFIYHVGQGAEMPGGEWEVHNWHSARAWVSSREEAIAAARRLACEMFAESPRALKVVEVHDTTQSDAQGVAVTILTLTKADCTALNPGAAVLDESSPAVQKADRAFKQWHGGAESQHVDEWSGRTDGPDKVLVHSYCGHCPAVDFIHSGPECDECQEHTQVVEGKDVTFFGHRVEFSGGQMPKLYKYKAGSKVFISGGGVDRLRKKFGDRLGRCPVFEYVVDGVKGSDKAGNHWVHTAHKPYGVWEWDDEVNGFRCLGGIYTATTWLDK